MNNSDDDFSTDPPAETVAEAWVQLVPLLEQDVTLVSNDNVQVKSTRSVLKVRSGLLKSLLSCCEDDKITIRINGQLLESMVNYIHTDSIPVLDVLEEISAGQSAKYETVEESIHKLWLQLKVANYLHLPGFINRVQALFTKKPELSFWLVQLQDEGALTAMQAVKNLAWQNIRNNKNGILCHDFVKLLPYSVMETLLEDNKYTTDEYHVYKMLQRWGSLGEIGEADEASAEAKVLSEFIQLHRINPDYLAICHEMDPPAVFSDAQFFQAFKSFAKKCTDDPNLARILQKEANAGQATREEILNEYKEIVIPATEKKKGEVILPQSNRRRAEQFPFPEAPTTIRVDGAGHPSANGTYHRAGDSNGKCQYTRFYTASQDGQQRGGGFHISFYGGTMWSIYEIKDVRRGGGFFGATDPEVVREVYTARVDDHLSELVVPPKHGWQVDESYHGGLDDSECVEISPPPTLSW